MLTSLTPNELIELLPYLTPRERAELDGLLSNYRAPLSFDDFLHEVTPSFAWHWLHLKYIRSKLDLVTKGLTDRLMLFVPPRHGKSEQVTVRYPAYRIDCNPAFRTIVGCYSGFLASKFSRKTRRIVSQRVPLSKERYAVDDWETTEGGGLRATGVGGGVTGSGADLIMIDDPVKSREEANSKAYREKVWEWYTDDLFTRLEPNGSMILIMTRWHFDDLAGKILQSDEAKDWLVIDLPALALDNDELGRLPGEALCPDRYDVEKLMRIKRIMKHSFESLYQQRPSPDSGNMIDRAWLKRYKVTPLDWTKKVQSWDTGFSASELANPSVCTTWGQRQKGHYLLDVFRDQVNYPSLKRTIMSLAEAHSPDAILIENKASGISVIQELRSETSLPIIPIDPGRLDKVARLAGVSEFFESELVYLPENAKWLVDYELELIRFPSTDHDDQVDSTSQYLNWVRKKTEIYIG